MVTRRTAKIALVVLAASGLVQLFAGVLEGLRQNWMGMAIYFTGAFLSIVICTGIPVALTIDACFRRLESLMKTSGRVRAGMETSNRRAIGRASRITQKAVIIVMVFCLPLNLSLAVFGSSDNSFLRGVHLAASAIIIVICMGALMALKVNARSRHLEEIIGGDNGGRNGGITGSHLEL